MAIIRKEAKKPNFLKEVSLFDGLQHKVLNSIFRLGMVQNFKKGDMILREGRPGGDLFILINGKVEVVKSVKGGRGKKLATLNRGSIFGEMSVFDGAPYSASVKALQDCDVHIMRSNDFMKFLRQNPKEGVEILSTLVVSISNRLRRANLALSLMGKG
jgi:CRP/FNR family transcriptional regulator, cyclic AMP receptor protein